VQIDVRWRPRFADNNTFGKSFSGKSAAVETDVLAHIDRLYLNQTTIKHPDRAETSKFWNFSLNEIAKTLHSALEAAVLQDAHLLWVDIGHHRIDFRLASSVENKNVHDLDAKNHLGTVQAHPLYIAPYEEAAGVASR
jgi:hypothetical protein